MAALAKCWFTRVHRPERIGRADSSGAYTGTCRHCRRRIASWDRQAWHLADGFNLESITRDLGGRFLYLVDIEQNYIIAHFNLTHLDGDEEAIAAYRERLREQHCSAQNAPLEIRDSAHPRGRPSRRAIRRGNSAGGAAPRDHWRAAGTLAAAGDCLDTPDDGVSHGHRQDAD